MTYLPPPKGTFDVEWATQNNRIIQQEIGKLGPLASRVSELETGKQPSDADLTAIAALTGTGMLERTGADTWALRSAGTVGRSLLALSAPGAIRHIRVNADGSVDLRAAADYRGDLGLGTAAVENIGTSGANVPLLNGNNTWSGTNGFQAVTAATLTTTGHIRSTGAVSSNVASNITLDFSGGFGRVSAYGPDNSTVGTLRLRAITANASAAGGIIDLSSTGAAVTGNTSITGTLSTTGNVTVSNALPILTLTDTDGGSANVLCNNGALSLRSDEANVAANKFIDFRVAGAERARLTSAGFTVTGTISASNLAGTTYTPTGTGVANVSSVTTYVTPYQRVGNTVTVGGRYQIEATAAGNVRARLSLPVASNFANNFDAGGSGGTTIGQNVAIYADAANDDLLFEFTAAAGGFFIFYFNATYRII